MDAGKLDTRLEIKVELYNMVGKKVIEENNTKRLDLSNLPKGIYNISIIHDNKRYSKKIIKQ